MEAKEIQELFHYNQWANEAILAASEKAGPEIFLAPRTCSFGSLRGTLVHIYGAETVWRMRCDQGISPAALPKEQDFPDLPSLKAAWVQEMRTMQKYIERLDQVGAATVRYMNTRGVNFETPLWQILIHLVNHGTQFRSEAGMILSAEGFSPGDVDMIAYFRQP